MCTKLSTVIFGSILFVSCQAEVHNSRGERAYGAQGSQIQLEFASDQLALGAIPATNVGGSIFCSGSAATFSGLNATLTSTLINQGGCEVRIASFDVNSQSYQVNNDPTTDQDWSENSVQRFVNASDNTDSVALYVSRQLPQILAGGQTYQVSFQIFQSDAAGELTPVQGAVATDSVTNAEVLLVEAPAFELTALTADASSGVPVYTFSFRCTAVFDAQGKACGDVDLQNGLAILASDLSLGDYNAAAFTSYYGSTIEQVETGSADALLLTIGSNGQLSTPIADLAVNYTAEGIEVSLPYHGNSSALYIYLQSFDPQDQTAPASSVTVGKALLD